MKKLLCLAMALFMLLACFGTALADDPAPKIVRLLSIESNTSELVELFNKSHTDIQMELVYISGGWDGVSQKLPAMIAANEAPDFAFMSFTDVAAYAAQGYLRDVTELVERDINMADFVPGVWEATMVEGKYWGVPYEIRVEQTWYDADVFDMMGVPYPSQDWNEAWTLEEWRENLPKLTGTNPETGDSVYGHVWQGNLWYWSQLQWLMAAYGHTSPFDENGRPIWDTPEMAQMLQDLYDMYQEGVLVPNDIMAESGYKTLFANNRLAMYTGGTWNAQAVVDMNVHAMPNVGGRTNYWIDTWIMFNGTADPDAQWEVAKWLCSKEYWDWKITEDVSCCLPIRADSFEEAKNTLWPWLTEADRDCLFQGAEEAFAFPMEYNIKMPALNNASEEILNMIKTGEYATAQETCEALQEYWQDIIDDNI